MYGLNKLLAAIREFCRGLTACLSSFFSAGRKKVLVALQKFGLAAVGYGLGV